jgi:hypothetical protein
MAAVADLLDDDFVEYGASGGVYNKPRSLMNFPARPPSSGP